MDWDDEYDDGYDDMDHASHREESMPDKSAEGGFDPIGITNPVGAYFFLSDDAQDEFGEGKDEMPLLRAQVHGRDLRQLPGVFQTGDL